MVCSEDVGSSGQIMKDRSREVANISSRVLIFFDTRTGARSHGLRLPG